MNMLAKAPQLKPQDVVVLLDLALRQGGDWTYPQVAAKLGMSASEVHAAIRRSVLARLAVAPPGKPISVNRRNLLEFLVHGARYAFPVVRGPATRGHPTSHAAPVLEKRIVDDAGLPPVWPDAAGPVRGESFSPLYPSASVVTAIVADRALYDAVALVDAIRGGSARERQVASGLLEKVLESEAAR